MAIPLLLFCVEGVDSIEFDSTIAAKKNSLDSMPYFMAFETAQVQPTPTPEVYSGMFITRDCERELSRQQYVVIASVHRIEIVSGNACLQTARTGPRQA